MFFTVNNVSEQRDSQVLLSEGKTFEHVAVLMTEKRNIGK